MSAIEHGTYAGAQTHRRMDEKACAACREAARLYLAAWRARQPKREPVPQVPCGTVGSYRRHLRRREQPCEACRAAQAAAVAAYRSGAA